jgi:hypothetical protein
MKKIKLKIQNGQDRENMIVALANAKYFVIVEVEEDKFHKKTIMLFSLRMTMLLRM